MSSHVLTYELHTFPNFIIQLSNYYYFSLTRSAKTPADGVHHEVPLEAHIKDGSDGRGVHASLNLPLLNPVLNTSCV